MKIAGKAGSHSYSRLAVRQTKQRGNLFQGGADERIFRKIKARGSLRREVYDLCMPKLLHRRDPKRYERRRGKAKTGEEAECTRQYMSIPSRFSTQHRQAQ